MGCVVSSEGDDERRRIIGVSAAAAGCHQQHIVSLTSSTYGILTAPRAYSSSDDNMEFESSSPSSPTATGKAPPSDSDPSPEVINSWELMAGLVDPSSSTPTPGNDNKARRRRLPLRPINPASPSPREIGRGGDAVLYTTSLRALRSTFEACNAVRAALQAHGVAFRERDVSMDRGFRDELLLRLLRVEEEEDEEARKPNAAVAALLLPRLFLRGRHVGGADEVLRLDEEGKLAALLEGLPRATCWDCDGCGGMRFLPCFDCCGSRKLPLSLSVPNPNSKTRRSSSLVVRCRECNENGLVLCPICS